MTSPLQPSVAFVLPSTDLATSMQTVPPTVVNLQTMARICRLLTPRYFHQVLQLDLPISISSPLPQETFKWAVKFELLPCIYNHLDLQHPVPLAV